jgi:hypothetical protein
VPDLWIRKIWPLGLMLLALTGCNRENKRVLPSQLDGFWTTDAPRYQDCFLELSGPYVIVGTGLRDFGDVQIVDNFERTEFGKQTAYTIYSSDLHGNHYQLAVRFDPANGGEIRIRNQPNVWRRVDGRTP